jgi:hypothetical protein
MITVVAITISFAGRSKLTANPSRAGESKVPTFEPFPQYPPLPITPWDRVAVW